MVDSGKKKLKQLLGSKKIQKTSLVILGLIIVIHFFWLIPFLNIPAQKEEFGAPMIPLVLAFFKLVLPWSLELIKTRLLFLILLSQPILLFLFIKEMTQRRTPALLAALWMNLPIWWFAKAKLESGLVYADGAHMATFGFFPLVSLFLLRFLRGGKFQSFLFTVIGIALIGLASPFSLLMFLFFGLVVAFSEMLLGFGRLKAMRFFAILICGAGLIAFWYNPSFIFEVLKTQRGQEILVVFKQLIPISMVLIPLLGSLGFLLFERRPSLQPLFLALGLFTIFFLLYLAGSAGNRVFATEAERFLPEVGLAFSFLLAVTVDKLFFRVKKIKKIGKLLSTETGMRLSTLVLIMVLTMGIVTLAGSSSLLAEEIGYLQQEEQMMEEIEHLSFRSWANFAGMAGGGLITLLTLALLYLANQKMSEIKGLIGKERQR